MAAHARSARFWRFQFIFWGLAGIALFVSGSTQMPLLQAAVRNLFLFVAGFLTSFFLAMLIDLVRGPKSLRTRLAAYSLAYVVALFCVVSINAITFTMQGVALVDITFGQWFSGTMNFALVFAFWAELIIQQVYLSEPGGEDVPTLDRLTVKSHGAVLSLKLAEILTINAAGDYVEIHTESETYLDRHTLQALETRLANSRFLRVHRSSLVNLDWVSSVTAIGKGRFRLQLKNGSFIESSRGYKDSLREQLL
jgi:DNA-binding LytR/AlgR family response regulator